MDRIVIVTKPTRLEELLLHQSEGAARFSLESRGLSLEPYEVEHAAYYAALAEVRRQIPNDVPTATVARQDLSELQFREKDLIVICGPDGLFVNAAKYIRSQPVLTVNPDPRTVSGVLMLFPPQAVGSVIAQVQEGKHQIEHLPFVKASIDDYQTVWGINDIFIGRNDQISARYEMSFGNQVERQSSSGIIISTGVGSTGWIRSISTMVSGIVYEGNQHKLSSLPAPTSNELVFVVREPFASANTGANMVTGRITPGKPLSVISEMPDGGRIFSDGVTEKSVKWNAGSTVVVSVGDRYIGRIVR
jgi:hypothetical protein